MKFLLILFIFDVSHGDMQIVHQDSAIFKSQEYCETALQEMKQFMELPNPKWRPFAHCIPESVFDDE